MTKTILISGANRGIGAEIARQLQQQGYQLSLGIRNPDAAIDRLPASSQVQRCRYQATDPDSGAHWVKQAVQRFGGIDAVVLCAGILRRYSIEQEDESDLDAMWEVNVKGPMRVIRAALPHLQHCGSGRVISLVSMSGKRVKGLSAGYAMSKYAQLALHHSVRHIGWEHGVRATALCPSWVNTEMATISSMAPEDMTQPKDIAALVGTLLTLPNNAVIPEIAIHCTLE